MRTFSPDARITGARITGGTTGIDVAAGATITDTTITGAAGGDPLPLPRPVYASGSPSTRWTWASTARTGSPFMLVNSSVHALESVRGQVDHAGRQRPEPAAAQPARRHRHPADRAGRRAGGAAHAPASDASAGAPGGAAHHCRRERRHDPAGTPGARHSRPSAGRPPRRRVRRPGARPLGPPGGRRARRGRHRAPLHQRGSGRHRADRDDGPGRPRRPVRPRGRPGRTRRRYRRHAAGARRRRGRPGGAARGSSRRVAARGRSRRARWGGACRSPRRTCGGSSSAATRSGSSRSRRAVAGSTSPAPASPHGTTRRARSTATTADGRSFLLARDGAQMNIAHAEVRHLGHGRRGVLRPVLAHRRHRRFDHRQHRLEPLLRPLHLRGERPLRARQRVLRQRPVRDRPAHRVDATCASSATWCTTTASTGSSSPRTAPTA